MSSQVWALEQMMKYEMKVNFAMCSINVGSYPRDETFYWDLDVTFYEALQNAVTYVNSF